MRPMCPRSVPSSSSYFRNVSGAACDGGCLLLCAHQPFTPTPNLPCIRVAQFGNYLRLLLTQTYASMSLSSGRCAGCTIFWFERWRLWLTILASWSSDNSTMWALSKYVFPQRPRRFEIPIAPRNGWTLQQRRKRHDNRQSWQLRPTKCQEEILLPPYDNYIHDGFCSSYVRARRRHDFKMSIQQPRASSTRSRCAHASGNINSIKRNHQP